MFTPSGISYTRLAYVYNSQRPRPRGKCRYSPPATGNKPNQAPLCRVIPRAQTPTQRRAESRSIYTHAAAKRTPPRCMHHLPLVTAHTVRSHKGHAGTHSAPVSAQVHTDRKNVQSHLFTGREGAAVPAGGQGEKRGGLGEPLCCRSTHRIVRKTGGGGYTRTQNTLDTSEPLIAKASPHLRGAEAPPGQGICCRPKGDSPLKTVTLKQRPDKSQPPLARENESKVSCHLQGRGHPSTDSSHSHPPGTHTPSRWRPSTSCNRQKT